MHIQSTVMIQAALERTWAFVSDPFTAPGWDRSIARVELLTEGPVGVGSIVRTTAPSGMRQSFQITEYHPQTSFTFALLESKIFRDASLGFHLTTVAEGTRLLHEIRFKLRGSALLLYPIFLLTYQKALRTDLALLKRALENPVEP